MCHPQPLTQSLTSSLTEHSSDYRTDQTCLGDDLRSVIRWFIESLEYQQNFGDASTVLTYKPKDLRIRRKPATTAMQELYKSDEKAGVRKVFKEGVKCSSILLKCFIRSETSGEGC